METIKTLLIVAGAGRNVGKTEFVCRLIQRWSRSQEIYALKVSAIHPDEAIYHGDHGRQQSGVHLYQETRADIPKDSSRMLRAGARKVFYLQGDDDRIRAGFAEFQRSIPQAAPVVCESGSLWKIVRPGLLVLVKAVNLDMKPRAVELAQHSSLIVESDGRSGFSQLSSIVFSKEHGWSLLPDSPENG